MWQEKKSCPIWLGSGPVDPSGMPGLGSRLNCRQRHRDFGKCGFSNLLSQEELWEREKLRSTVYRRRKKREPKGPIYRLHFRNEEGFRGAYRFRRDETQ